MTIYVTGGLGFIGHNLIKFLNYFHNISNIIVVDEWKDDNWKSVQGMKFVDLISPKKFIEEEIFSINNKDTIIHFGAITDTNYKDMNALWENNVQYTKKLIGAALETKCHLIYASSASVYGDGDCGFSDRMTSDEFSYLKPKNPYAMSKWLVDNLLFTLPKDIPITGLRYFNVWGPGEERKGNMASFMTKNLESFRTGQEVKLWKLTDSAFSGPAARDFVYIKDVCKVTTHFLFSRQAGIYNVGRGVAETWETMCNEMYRVFDKQPKINYIEPNADLTAYQYYTKAEIGKLREAGYKDDFMTVRQSCEDYLRATI